MGNKRNRVAHRRSLFTREGYQHAIEALGRAGGGRPIPVAYADQAAFEALFLERVGEVDLDLWEPTVLPFGISWVSPYPDSIDVGVPRRYLPDIIRQIIPTVFAEDTYQVGPECGDVLEVQGIPGLRFRYEAGHVVLYRPGRPGRIRIPAKEITWRKALWIALRAWDDRATVLWDSHPNEWHPLETRFVEDWPARFRIDGEHYRASRLASDVLRRLPGICRPPSCHDMWVNFHGRTAAEYYIQLEWAHGLPPAPILDLLLDPEFGLNVDIQLTYGQQTQQDCYTDDCSHVRLISLDGTGSRIDLRRLMHRTSDQESPLGLELRRRSLVERREHERLFEETESS